MISIIIILLLLILLLGIFMAGSYLLAKAYAKDLLYISTDTCSYEIYRDLMISYTNLTGDIVKPSDLGGVRLGVYKKVVLLATNISSRELIEYVTSRLISDPPPIIIFSQHMYEAYKNNLSIATYVPDEYIWRYCLYSDNSSLHRIAEIIWRAGGQTLFSQIFTSSLPMILGLIAAVVATAYTLSQYGREILDRFRDILIKLIGVLIIPILRIKISEKEILDHPLRKRIYEYVSSKKITRFSDLLKDLGAARGSLEWHLYLLMKYNIVQEINVGRKRYIIDPSKPKEVLKKLLEEDKDFRCVWSKTVDSRRVLSHYIDEKIVYEISLYCEIDPGETKKILIIINSLMM